MEIEKDELFSSEQGSYPLVHLNLKAIHPTSFEDLLNSISFLISDLYGRYPELENSACFLKNEKDEYESFLVGEKDPIKLSFSLYKLIKFLNKHYEKKVVILIDEYDSPILRLEGDGRFNEALAFFRSFYGMVLKGNYLLKYAAVTGVLQIAKESLFSDLNNLNVDNVLYGNYSEFFGFDEEETFKLLQYYGYDSFYNEVKNGMTDISLVIEKHLIHGRCLNSLNQTENSIHTGFLPGKIRFLKRFCSILQKENQRNY